MPQARTRFAAAVFNNQIWVIGGYDNVAGSGEHRNGRSEPADCVLAVPGQAVGMNVRPRCGPVPWLCGISPFP